MPDPLIAKYRTSAPPGRRLTEFARRPPGGRRPAANVAASAPRVPHLLHLVSPLSLSEHFLVMEKELSNNQREGSERDTKPII